jgi:hypothetical protein
MNYACGKKRTVNAGRKKKTELIIIFIDVFVNNYALQIL